MSYCVNCGVELDPTAAFCPLCHTGVHNPEQPVDTVSPPPFPRERLEVPDESKQALAILLSSMLLSVAVCCGVLNLFLRAGHIWSLYVIGAAVMLWVWLVPPLLHRRLRPWLHLLLDVLAVAVYILLICVDLRGWDWYLRLALPILAAWYAAALFLGFCLKGGKRSILSSFSLGIGTTGIYTFLLEFFIDLYFDQLWTPSWSLIVFFSCIALIIPLMVIRRVPALREEVRRRFHL